jgi:thioredoxin-related protein
MWSNTQMKLLYFWKKSCPYCERMSDNLDEIGVYPDLSISSDTISDAHRNKYGIELYPTLVFIAKDGSVLGKLTGLHQKDNIVSTIKTYKKTESILKK